MLGELPSSLPRKGTGTTARIPARGTVHSRLESPASTVHLVYIQKLLLLQIQSKYLKTCPAPLHKISRAQTTEALKAPRPGNPTSFTLHRQRKIC